MTDVTQVLSPTEAVEHYASAHRGNETPLPDVVDAVANMSNTDTDIAKSAIFWLIGRGRAHMTPSFMVAFPA